MSVNTPKPERPSVLDVLKAVRDGGRCKNTKAGRLLLDALVLRANYRTWQCHPSYKTLSTDTGVHTKTLRQMARNLELAGLIRREVKGRSSCLFTLRVDTIMGYAHAEKLRRKESRLQSTEGDGKEKSHRNEEETTG